METSPHKIGIDARLWSETGVGRYIRNLVSNLEKSDSINSYYLFLTKENFEKVTVSNPNFHKRLADIPWHSLKEQTVFPKLLEKEKLDLMHFPYFSIPLAYRGKFVVTIHDLIMHHFSTGKASTLPTWKYVLKVVGYKAVMQLAAMRAEKILAVSNATKKEIVDHLHISPEKIIVTYEGVDDQLTSGNIQKSIEKPPSTYFLYVGNAYPHKNIERLLQSFELFKNNTNNDCQLLLVGKDDFFYKKIQEKLSDEQRKYIIILHNVSDASLHALYLHAKALVFVSLMEGFGLPALEALSLGKRVIVSDIPVMHEVCGEQAYYVDPYEPKAIAKTMETLYTLPNDVAHEKIAKEWSKKFSWMIMANETKKVYESCISIR